MATTPGALLLRNASKTHRFIFSRIINQCQSPIPTSPAVLESRTISPLRSVPSRPVQPAGGVGVYSLQFHQRLLFSRTASTFCPQTQPKYEDTRSSYRRQNSQRGGGKSKSFWLGPLCKVLLLCGLVLVTCRVLYKLHYLIVWMGAKSVCIEAVGAFYDKVVQEEDPYTSHNFMSSMATIVGQCRNTLESEIESTWVCRIQPFNQMQLRLLEEISEAFEAMEDKATAGTVFHFGPSKLHVDVSYRGFHMEDFQRKAAIGGTFNLTNHVGKNVTEKDFLGKWTMACFGSTPCPDDLRKLAAAVDKIKEKAGFEIVPIYISNDPVRDTVGPLHKLVKEFHPNLISLTGSLKEIEKVARIYGVAHVPAVPFPLFPSDLKFPIETSTVMCLMGPNRDYVRLFWKHSDSESLADAAIKLIEFKSKK